MGFDRSRSINRETKEKGNQMHWKRFLIAVVLALSFLPELAMAGAWTREKGHFYTKASINTYYSEKYYNDEGKVTTGFDFGGATVENPDYYKCFKDSYFLDVNATFYAEYGLLDWITIVTSIPYKYHRYDGSDMVADTWGIGDIDVAAKVRILQKPFILSAQLLGKFPWAYDEDDFATLGNGQPDIEIRLRGGWSLWPVPAYAGVELAYRFRLEAPPDEFRFLIEFGYSFTERFYGRTKLDGIISIRNEDLPEQELSAAESTVNPVVTPSVEYDLVKLELAVGYKLTDRLDIEVMVTPTILGRGAKWYTREDREDRGYSTYHHEGPGFGATFSIGVAYTY